MLQEYRAFSEAQSRNLFGGDSGGGISTAALPVYKRIDTAATEITIEHGFYSMYVTPTIYTLDGYLMPPTRIKSIKVGDTNDQKWIRIIFTAAVTAVIKISQ